MAIQHAASGQSVSVVPAASDLGARQSVAIFKTNQLEVMRLVLPKGKTMPAHQVVGDITVQCLEGAISLTINGATQVLAVGEMLYLAGDVPHSLTGLEDALALVHIVLRQ